MHPCNCGQLGGVHLPIEHSSSFLQELKQIPKYSSTGAAVAPVQVSLDVLTSAIVVLLMGHNATDVFYYFFSLSHNDSAKIYDNRG